MSADPVIAQNIVLIRRFIDEVVNAGKYELIDEIWAADLAWHGGSLGEIESIGAYTRFITGAKDAFRDMHLTVHDVVAAGDKVVVRFTNSGVQTGPFSWPRSHRQGGGMGQHRDLCDPRRPHRRGLVQRGHPRPLDPTWRRLPE